MQTGKAQAQQGGKSCMMGAAIFSSSLTRYEAVKLPMVSKGVVHTEGAATDALICTCVVLLRTV